MKRLIYIICLMFLSACAAQHPHKLKAGDIGVDATFHNLTVSGTCIGCGSGTVSGVTAFGIQSSGTQTCPNTAATCSVTLSGSGVTLSAAPPLTGAATLVWQVLQNATGGFAPTWGTVFHFDTGASPVPLTNANKGEQFMFVWNAGLAQWDYVARGATQLVATTNQGNSEVWGCNRGNVGNTNLPCSLALNTWTNVCSDNGGFTLGGGTGLGVANFTFVSHCNITLYNPNTTTEVFSTYCDQVGFNGRVSPDAEIDSNQTMMVTYSHASPNQIFSNFGNFHCYVNPTNTLLMIKGNEWTNEIPQN